MAKAARLSHRLETLERDYRWLLAKALKECADGRWGLFGRNEHLHSIGAPPKLDELRGAARTIDRIRAQLGEPPFPLHERFEAARGRGDPNDPGEPKLAQRWLALTAELHLEQARDDAESAEALIMRPANFRTEEWLLAVTDIVSADEHLRRAREIDPTASLPLLDQVLEDLRDLTDNFTKPEFFAATKAGRRGNPKLFEPRR